LKGILFYPGIILSAGWTLINILRMITYIDQLKNEFPECTASNPLNQTIFLSTIAALALFKLPIERGSRAFFEITLPVGKFPKGTELRE
jgi:hypothetical protein